MENFICYIFVDFSTINNSYCICAPAYVIINNNYKLYRAAKSKMFRNENWIHNSVGWKILLFCTLFCTIKAGDEFDIDRGNPYILYTIALIPIYWHQKYRSQCELIIFYSEENYKNIELEKTKNYSLSGENCIFCVGIVIDTY